MRILMKNRTSEKTRQFVPAAFRKLTLLVLIIEGISMTVRIVAAVPTLTITGQLVPGQLVPSAEESGLVLSPGSTMVYPADGFLHVYLPDGSEQFMSRVSDSPELTGPHGKNFPAARTFQVGSESRVAKEGEKTLTVSDAKGNRLVTIRDEVNPIGNLISGGLCTYSNSRGFVCFVVVTTDNNMIMTGGL
jgi:hypothetical protein